MGGEFNTLDISPEELTITELNNPEEERERRENEVGINYVPQTVVPKKNSKSKHIAGKLNQRTVDKVGELVINCLECRTTQFSPAKAQ